MQSAKACTTIGETKRIKVQHQKFKESLQKYYISKG